MKYVLIPAYEPDNNLISLLKELSKYDVKVVVVDDGSGPSFTKIFSLAKKYAQVISYEVNRGKGYALKTGIKYITNECDNYAVVTMDSDGQHTVSDALKLLDYVKTNQDVLVLGKRLRDNYVPLRSRLGNGITKAIFSLITGLNIYDTQTGLRAFSSNLVSYMLKIEGNRYEYEMNCLLKAKNAKVKIKEIPIETIYHDNNKNSHFKTIKDSFLIYKDIIKFSLSSLIAFGIDYLIYSLLILCGRPIIIANVLARVFSSIVNFISNKRVVFASKENILKEMVKYFSLVVLILFLNTIILTRFSLVVNPLLAKIMVEIGLFGFSYLMQKKVVFKRGEERLRS